MACFASCAPDAARMKAVRKILPTPRQHWVGDGFHVYPVFHNLAFTEELSPWLMFDYAAPEEFPPTKKRRGVGTHPHRGFETVTIAFQGEIEHGDNVGNSDVIGPGDVQWMTAARGIVHKEFHSTEFSQRGGIIEMAQLWLNLPSKNKMDPPKYQPILSKEMPVVDLAPAVGADPVCDGSFVKLIAGELQGVRGPAATHSPVELFDITLKTRGVPYVLSIPEGHNTILFVRRGRALVGAEGSEQPVEPQGVALMHTRGTTLRVVPDEKDTQLLLLGGQPLKEPIAARGPFVMNTERELDQAFSDYSRGRF